MFVGLLLNGNDFGRDVIRLVTHFGAKLFLTPGDTGHHGAHRHVQNLGDLLVAVLLEIKERQRRTEGLVKLGEKLHGTLAVHLSRRLAFTVIRGELVVHIIQISLWKTGLSPRMAQVLAVKCGEKPGLCLGLILELVPLLGPDTISLLDKVRCSVRALRQRIGETIERLIMLVD